MEMVINDWLLLIMNEMMFMLGPMFIYSSNLTLLFSTSEDVHVYIIYNGEKTQVAETKTAKPLGS